MTHDSHMATSLGHLGWNDRDSIIFILCRTAQGGQGKYGRRAILLTFSRTDFANNVHEIKWRVPFLSIYNEFRNIKSETESRYAKC
jgi:hypothetical protein